MPNDMRILMGFVEGEAVHIGNKDFIVSDIREDRQGGIQITFKRQQFLTKRPEDEKL